MTNNWTGHWERKSRRSRQVWTTWCDCRHMVLRKRPTQKCSSGKTKTSVSGRGHSSVGRKYTLNRPDNEETRVRKGKKKWGQREDGWATRTTQTTQRTSDLPPNVHTYIRGGTLDPLVQIRPVSIGLWLLNRKQTPGQMAEWMSGKETACAEKWEWQGQFFSLGLMLTTKWAMFFHPFWDTYFSHLICEIEMCLPARMIYNSL